MVLNRMMMLFVLCLSACVVENEVESESEPEAPEMDASVDTDASNEPEVDAQPEQPESCMQEDDLFGTTPAVISAGFSRNDLFLCADTTDVFELSGEPGQEVLIKLGAEPLQNDLDLTLVDLDGTVLASSAEENGAESIVFSFSELVPTVRIEVSGYRDVSSAYYLGVIARCSSDRDCPEGTECSRELGVCEVQEPVDCGLDEYEPNNREDTATALSDLPVNTEAILCGKDVDWFELSVNRGDIIDILVNFPGGVDLDLEVLNASDGTQIAEAIGDSRSNPERLALSHLEEGSYLLAVRRYVGDDETDGDITYQLEIVGRSGGCTSSAECLASGQPICEEGICVAAPPSAPLGAVCGRDEDCAEGADLCYEGGAGGQDNLCTVLCESDGGCDELGDGAYCIPISWQEAVCVPACTVDSDCGSFYVCGEGRCVVDSACRIDSDCGDERICRTAQNGERYCARPTLEESCGLDEDFEPNDRFSNAIELPVGQRVQDLRICNADNDFFSFEVPQSITPWNLTLDATFRSGTDIDIYVYDALGNLLGESTSPAQTTEVVNVSLLAGGTVFLRVDQFDSDQLSDTVYSVLATLEESESRCTIAGEECGQTEPLRSICDEESGSCSSLEGGGEVELGGSCDSEDDCVDTADLCWRYGMGSEPICTLRCERDSDCAEVGETSCVPIRRGLRLCL